MNSNVLNEHMEKIYRVYPRYITLVNTQHERLHVHCMTQENLRRSRRQDMIQCTRSFGGLTAFTRRKIGPQERVD